MANQPYYQNFDWKRRRPLLYQTGAEPRETLVLYASTVALDADSRRTLAAGTILCEITSGDGDGKYGPYLKTASDGRQTIGSSVQPYVLQEGVDATLFDQPVAGLWAQCVFDASEIEDVNDISHADLSTLKTAFPNAEWH